jgi:RHS repeat-associated protein
MMSSNTGSVWIDERPIFEGFPLNTKLLDDSSSASLLSYTSNVPIQVWIEDLDVKLLDKNAKTLTQEDSQLLVKPLIWEGFNKYEIGQFPEDGGWVRVRNAIPEGSDRGTVSYQAVSPENRDSSRADPAANDKRGFYIDGQEFVSGPRSLKMDSSIWPVQAAKKISLPEKAPFGISEGTFAIVEGTGDEERNPEEQDLQDSRRSGEKRTGERDYVLRNKQLLKSSSQERVTSRLKSDDKATGSAETSGENTVKILSAYPAGSYYIYSFDGKLMAEYNLTGQLVRDYIYIGNQLVAEYRGGSTYYYYASDQVNSTRIVTDGLGNVAYSAAYDPFGGIQKTWEPTTYTPTMKFSGKERDEESQLDYFGARYFANVHYRFLSVDPVIGRVEAIENPQLWNLYSLCHNNPVTYWDPDGRIEGKLAPLPTTYNKWNFSPETRMRTQGTLESNVDAEKVDGKFSPRFKYDVTTQITLNKKGNNEEILEHEQHHMEGFEWLYDRNRNELIKAEGRTFESKQEALDYGRQVYKDITSYRPFKWNLYRGDFNPLTWFFHKQKWESWAQKKDWN